MATRKSALEKEFYSAIPQSLTIKQLLQVPSQHRTIQHCKAIINHVKNVSFLERYMNSNEIFGIAKEMELKSYDARSTVFNHGDVADNFYIVLSGAVKLYIPMPYQTKKVSDLKEVMVLGKGEAFGELALLYDSVRSATVVTTEPCDFIVLNKESFRKHIKTISTTHMGQIMEFYQEFAAFQSLSTKDIVKYATKSLFYKFSSNTVVVREGDFPEEIFFVKSGRVKVIKRLNFKFNPKTKTLQFDDPEEPTKEDIALGCSKSMLIQIDELSPGDSFCDVAILNKEPMHHTIICSMPCELIALPHYDLKTMSPALLQEYQALCKTYPDDTELRKSYLDLTKWNSWKKNLYKNIQIDKANKRRGFDQQLRGPFVKRIQLEKLTIPLETDIKTNLLNMINQTVQTARAGTQSRMLESPTYNNVSRLKTGQTGLDGGLSRRKQTVPLLPKISTINTTGKDMSSIRHGSYSHRDYSSMSMNKLKFDFVVPKHRLANYEEKVATTQATGGELINYNEGVVSTELTDEKARALVNFNFEEMPPLMVSDENLDEEKKSTPDEKDTSVLGTGNIESAFTKVMSTMNLDMPNMKKKYKVKGPALF